MSRSKGPECAPAYIQQFVVPRHLPWNVQGHEVESARSDKPTFAISLNFQTQTDPETPFPSIFTPVHLLRSLEGTADIDRFCSVASIFLQNTAALLRAAPGIPPATRSSDNYKNAQRCVGLIAETLREKIAKITATPGHPEQVQDDLLFALGLVEMMVSSLKVYFKVSGLAKTLNTPTKPLPPTPSYMSEKSIDLVTTIDPLDDLGPELCVPPAKVLHFETAFPPSCSPRAPARIIHKRSFLNVLTRKSNKISIFSSSTKSSATLVGSDLGASATWHSVRPTVDVSLDNNILLSGTVVKQEKFAQQLTINAFERFVVVDPVDAVSYWRQHGDASSERSKLRKDLDAWFAFERSLTSWVSFTILQLHSAEKRADLISFWLKVSVICMRFRNFSSCRCIFNGVAHSSIRRLKKSVLLVPIDNKIYYRSLECFFDGHRNYSSYRRILGSCFSPTIPLLDPLVRDVISTRMATGMSKKIMAQTISTLESCRFVYPFVREDKIQATLDREFHRCLALMEESLFETSCRQEHPTENTRWNVDPWAFLICKKASGHLRPVDGICCH